ncbi:hypothetical protein LSH36_91g06005 [Paralvinella palmiformis]|uniref:Uncharacterized protein n=1 Tax=Paralvinella palmiformis TaxID=53620 RepID=A0AAD9K1R8_9ANNE|nr:hypothetical protein LSH36_91g06005 [Paralvinella palmiformis]
MYIARKGRFNTDGLNTLEYSVLQVVLHPLYTWIYVGYNETFYKIQAVAARKEALETIAKKKPKLDILNQTLTDSNNTLIPH